MRELKKPNFVKNKKLVRTTTFLAVLLIATTLLLSGSVTSISISGESTNLNTTAKPITGSKRDLSPNIETGLKAQPEGPRDIWDVQFDFDVTAASGAAGNAGAEWDGSYFYTNRWASNLIHKYNPDGTLVGAYTITGVSGLRDLAFDGTYMWGGDGAGTLWKMDFNSWSLEATYTGSFQVRAIAYGDDDIIYASGWADPVYKIDPATGTIVGQFNLGTTTSTYGFAYDGLTAGGPFLWVYDQGAGAATPQYIHQWDLAAGAYTGVQHDTTIEFPDPSGIAGGLFFADDFEPGFSTLGGLQQGVPDRLFCYEIGMTTAPEHDVALKSIDAPTSGPAAGSFTPKVSIKNNGNNSETLSVNMKINAFTTPTDIWCDGFESGIPGGWAFPCGWTVETTNPTGTWFLYSSGTTYSSSTYPRVQESGSDGNAQDESLISPSIDCSALSAVYLRMSLFYFYAYTPDYANFTIYVSNNGGSTWNQVVKYTATTTGNRYINVGTYAAGYSNVKFKFRFDSGADTTLSSYCYFDNLWVGQPASWGPLGNNPPPGMDIQNYPSNPTTWNYNYWYNYSNTYTSYDNIGPAARYYYTSPYEDVDCALITPSIDCSLLDKVNVYMNGYFYFYSGYTHGCIEYSIDNGVNWNLAYDFLATRYCYEFDGYNDFNLPLAAHEGNVKVRFRYYHTAAEAGRYWYIGNIRVGSDRCNIVYYDSMQGTTAYSTNFKVWAPDDWVNWAWEQVSGTGADNKWLNVNTGTLPTCSPYEGTHMAEYYSYYAPIGEKARLYNLNPINVGTANSLRVSFMMYHYSSGTDQLQVQYNDGVSGWQDAGAPFTLIGTTGWALEEVDIPVPASGQIQIGFLGISANGYNIFIDDVCIYDPGLVTEYIETKTVSINVGETKQVSFPNWIPDAWHNQQNVNIIYPISAWIELTGDQNPSNDQKATEITLNYPFFHDIAVLSVDSPTEDGPAKTLPVGCTIKNVGQYDECCYQTQMEIGTISLGSVILDEPFTVNSWTVTNTKWSKVSSANAGGTAPEYRFYYSPSETGTFLVYSPPIDTTGAAAAELSWKHMVNHFTTPYTLAVMTSTDATNWEIVWSIDPTGAIPAKTETITVSSGIGSSTFYIAFAFIGYSYNINYWYVDDVKLQAMSLSSEYTDTVCTIELEPGESAELEFDDWTPAALALGVSGDIGYIAQAEQMLPSDTNPDNDVAGSSFTLSYWHDVKVKDITSPSMGRGDVIFAQRPFLPTETWTFRSSCVGGGYLCQDNFWDLTNPIGDIEFWGLCLIYSAGWLPGNPNTLPFELIFYEDGGTAPGAVVETFQLPAITPVNTGLTYSGFTMYYWTYDLPTSIGLADGWISIQSTTAPDNAWLLWAGSPEGDLNMWQQGASPPQVVGDCAFNLSAGGPPGPVDVSVWVPLNSDESISGIVQNLGTFGENGLTCYAEIYEYITNESGVQIYSDSVANIDLGPLGDEEAVIFDPYTFAVQGTYNLILNIPLPADNDDFPANNIKKLGIGCDNTKPVSTHTLNPAIPDGLNGWYVSDLTVTVDANDGTEEWQSGVKEIKYKIGSGSVMAIPGAHGSFKVETDGENIPVEYWAVDKVGNEESHHTFTVDMDQTKPEISLTYEVTGGNPLQGYELTWTATAVDETSKMDRVEFLLNGVLQSTVTGPGPTYEWVINYYPLPKTYFRAIGYDLAGNSDYSEIEDPTPHPHSNEQTAPHGTISKTVKLNLGR